MFNELKSLKTYNLTHWARLFKNRTPWLYPWQIIIGAFEKREGMGNDARNISAPYCAQCCGYKSKSAFPFFKKSLEFSKNEIFLLSKINFKVKKFHTTLEIGPFELALLI